MYEEALSNYPEYFQEEVQYRRQYDAIPKEVHDAYFEDIKKLFDWEMKNNPTKGLMYMIDHPEEDKKWRDKMIELAPERKRRNQEIWDKHYKSYNLKRFN